MFIKSGNSVLDRISLKKTEPDRIIFRSRPKKPNTRNVKINRTEPNRNNKFRFGFSDSDRFCSALAPHLEMPTFFHYQHPEIHYQRSLCTEAQFVYMYKK